MNRKIMAVLFITELSVSVCLNKKHEITMNNYPTEVVSDLKYKL